MPSFLQDVIDQIEQRFDYWEELIFVLPSKRAGNFLKNEIRSRYTQTGFAPRIWSIEEFIQEVADLKLADSTTLTFWAYQSYLSLNSIKNKDSFDQFSSWAPALLADLNEMDRYCLDTNRFFSHLSEIKAMERWNLTEESTDFINNYLAFWKNIPQLYEDLTNRLLTHRVSYQGLIYRKAAEDIEHYIQAHQGQVHIFIGFNALNAAEQIIFQELLQREMALVFWDADQYFADQRQHMVTNFLNTYLKNWGYYQNHQPQSVHREFEKEKKINLVQTESNLTQVYYTSALLSELSQEQLQSTAVVLADEHLLMPLLHSIPQQIDQINITMGAPLSIFPVFDLFRLLLVIQQQAGKNIYHKHLDGLLNHPVINYYLEYPQELSQKIKSQNLAYVPLNNLLELANPKDHQVLGLMLRPWTNSDQGISSCLKLLELLRLKQPADLVLRTSAFSLYQLFLQIQSMCNELDYVEQLATLHNLYLELGRTKQIDFESDAFQGLQIMGLLETRCLDFDRVIVLSVNEGVLPAGRSPGSFLTYDLKKEYELPTQQDKDAVYAYHFYRLMFRAKEVDILYVDQSQGLGSKEKSRFIRELQLDPPSSHSIQQLSITTPIKINPSQLREVPKTPALYQRLELIAAKGFSPSSLTNYIRNPLDFYSQRVLGIQEVEEVEETVAYNTLGNVVHNSLENLYKPWEGQLLNEESLALIKSGIKKEVSEQFRLCFKQGNMEQGKNLIIAQVAHRYVEQLVQSDLDLLHKGHSIEIVSLEEELEMEIRLPAYRNPIRVYGKADRIDRLDGQLRIVDFKTGKVESSDLKVSNWTDIIEDYKYAKAFQVLCYALMLWKKTGIMASFSGIISFKRMSNGYMAYRDGNGSELISESLLLEYEKILIQLISEIMDPEVQLKEKLIQ